MHINAVRHHIDIKLKATFVNLLKATYLTINDLVYSYNTESFKKI